MTLENVYRHRKLFQQDKHKYPTINRCASLLLEPDGEIIGRDTEDLRRKLRNPEKSNVAVLGEPGSGKTALLQGFAFSEKSGQYLVLSIDAERLAKDDATDKDSAIANGLLDLTAEVREYSLSHNVIVVLFIDEFHRIPMMSKSSIEALKPILEKSAKNGFRVVAVTTFEEYEEHIAPNRALDQRFLRIYLQELPREAVIEVLKNRASLYNALDLAEYDIFDQIYDHSKSILLSNSQPRASIDLLLNMVGEITKDEYMEDGQLYRVYATPEELNILSDYPLSRPILNRVIQTTYGIDIDHKVDMERLQTAIRDKILHQEQAIESVLDLLQMASVGFSESDRPKMSFLSSGSTGTGKAIDDDELVYVYTPVGKSTIRHGDLKPGMLVYGMNNELVEIEAVFPQGLCRVWVLELEDGRTVRCNKDHLWLKTDGFVVKTFELQTGDGIPTDRGSVPVKRVYATDEYVSMQCIYLDDEEHVYQLANGVITHNTELAKIISNELGIPLKRFDMSRYPNKEDATKFADDLAQAAWSAPNAYILLDEVEKSSREAMNILLQVLDDARLTAANNPNRVISFTGNIINLTTNIASEIYRDVNNFGDDGFIDIDVVYKALKNSPVFETAVLGRVDKIVPFKPLPDEVKEAIANDYLMSNVELVATRRAPILVSEDITKYVIIDRTQRDTESGGARDAKRNIKSLVLSEIAKVVANREEELPLVVHLIGNARFKVEDENDPLAARIGITECYPMPLVDKWLQTLSGKVGKKLHNHGLFLPKYAEYSRKDRGNPIDPNTYIQPLVELVKKGHREFATLVDGEEFIIVGLD